MSCTNCYTTNSAAPCGTVGCLSTNYSKCILYSGNNLYCQTGTIETVNFSGVAVSPVSDTTVTVSCTGGTGSGATFSVTRTAGFTTYSVSIVNKGLGYTVGDVLTILGTSLGGTSSNNILVTVSGLTPIISNSDSIDEIILNLHQRLCLTSTSGLDYSTFNYSCLRVGGNLTGVGTTITTAQQFTESTAAALCALNTRVIAVEKPAITVPGCLSSFLTSGTSTLVNILDTYASFICTLNINTNLSAVTGNPCVGYAFTTKPVNQVVLADYINWITTNMCGMFTTNNNLILAQTAKVNALYTYITGSTSGSVPASIDTSCLSGGSLTSSLKDAIVLIKNNLCSLNTTVAGLGGSSTVTLNWGVFATSTGDCGGSFINSPYAGLPIIASTNTLTNHLNNITTILNRLRMGFSVEFSVNNAASNSCGTYSSISLNPGNNNDIFVYDTSGVSKWTNKSLNVTVNGSSTGVTKTVTSGAMVFDLTIPSSASTSVNLTLTGTTSWSFPLGWGSNGVTGGTTINTHPAVYKNNNIVTLGSNSAGTGGTILKIAVGSGGSYPVISSGTYIPVCTIPTTYRPAQVPGGNEFISGTIIKSDSSHNVVATYPVIIQVNSFTGDLWVRFVTAITAPASTDYFMLPLGGISWNI
jgi:hypothetical protein